jgi:hypothetical protein
MSLTAVLFILVFAGFLLAALVRSPVYGLYAYLATFYLHPVDRWWGRDLPDLRWALLAAAVTFLATLRLPKDEQRPGFLQNGAAVFLVGMAAWLWIQNLWALSSEDHQVVSFLFTKYVVLYYLMYRLLDSETAIRNFLLVHVLGCMYLGWLVLQAPDSGRLEGVGGPGIDEANSLGMHLGTGAFAAAVLLFRTPAWIRACALLSLPLILNGIIQTDSRGAFLAIACAGLVFLYFSPGRLRRYWVLLGIAGLALLIRVAPANYWERISTILNATDDTAEVDQSTRTRLALFAAQWKMFLAYPYGTGHRGTAYLSPRYLKQEELARSRSNPEGVGARSSHNTFMTALTEQGVPGVLLYVGLVLWIVRTTRATARAAADGADGPRLQVAATAATLVVVLAAGMFTDYFKAEVFVWGITLLAALQALLVPRTAAATASDRPLPAAPGAPRPAGPRP